MADLLLKMRHPENVGASWRGQTYEPDAEGDIAVPFEAAGDLIDHGFAPSGQIGGEEPAEVASEPAKGGKGK